MSDRELVSSLARRYQLSQLLHLVVELDVGERLAAGESLEAIAHMNGVKLGALRSATQALSAVAGIFDVTGDGLTASGRALLDPSSVRCVGPMVEHEIRQQSLWHSLGAALDANEPIGGQQDIEMANDEGRLNVLLRAMKAMNPELITQVAALDAWTDRTEILDVAGGHGAFLAGILGADPSRSGSVLDQPTARAECESTLVTQGVSDRASFEECDLTEHDPLEGWSADAVLLCRCLHNFAPLTIESILRSAESVLKRSGGGVCVVVERHLMRDGSRLVPRESALFSAYMAINCAGGHVPRTEWLHDALSRIGSTERIQLGELHSAFVCEVQ